MDISKLPVIPQYLGTCWFNAILMSLLYSDGCQETFYNIAIRDRWFLNRKGESFKFLLFKILDLLVRIKNETDAEKLEELYQKLEELYQKNKPEKIFLKYAYKYDYSIRDRLEIGYNGIYIITFLKNLGINVLDIIFQNGNYYIGYLTFHQKFMIRPNEVLEEIQKLITNGADFLIKLEQFNSYLNIPERFNVSYFKSFIFNNIIILDEKKYTLRSLNISNYNNPIHAISGIIFEGDYYVYNGWINTTNQKSCPLFPFNWNLNQPFCINTENCELVLREDTKDLCFNFFNGYKIKIYTSSSQPTELLRDVKSFKNLSHITSHIENYYDDLLHIRDKEKIIEKIIEFKYYSIQNLEGIDKLELYDLKKILKNLIYSHYVLEKKENESIHTLQSALLEAEKIKIKAKEEIKILKEQALKDIEIMRIQEKDKLQKNIENKS